MSYTNDDYTMGEMYRLGIDYLVDKFGFTNTEKFFTAVKTGNFDYTKWRANLFDDMFTEGYDKSIIDYGRTIPRRREDRHSDAS